MWHNVLSPNSLEITLAKYENNSKVLYFDKEIENVFKPLKQETITTPIQGEIALTISIELMMALLLSARWRKDLG